MKYERLTIRQFQNYEDRFSKDTIYGRLQELENKIEEGTLMEIDKPFVKPTKFGKYLLCKATVFLLEVFNTKAEAEEKLEEMIKSEE